MNKNTAAGSITKNVIKVGMADLKVSPHPGMLVTLGLGSCVGVALYDPETRIIGMAHIMLPSSLHSRKRDNRAKFADTALEKLIQDMQELGAEKQSIKAKIAGGAQMFSFSSSSDIMRIGERNVVSVKQRLLEYGIDVVSEDTGGRHGRTVEFYSDQGRMVIRTIGHGIKEI